MYIIAVHIHMYIYLSGARLWSPRAAFQLYIHFSSTTQAVGTYRCILYEPGRNSPLVHRTSWRVGGSMERAIVIQYVYIVHIHTCTSYTYAYKRERK
jgi:hypothetical protein